MSKQFLSEANASCTQMLGSQLPIGRSVAILTSASLLLSSLAWGNSLHQAPAPESPAPSVSTESSSLFAETPALPAEQPPAADGATISAPAVELNAATMPAPEAGKTSIEDALSAVGTSQPPASDSASAPALGTSAAQPTPIPQGGKASIEDALSAVGGQQPPAAAPAATAPADFAAVPLNLADMLADAAEQWQNRSQASKQGKHQPLQIPKDAVNTDFLKGRWLCETGLTSQKGEPLVVGFEFLADGSGTSAVRETNGDIYTAQAKAAIKDGRLSIETTRYESPNSPQGYEFQRIECWQEGALARCFGVNGSSDSQWDAHFQKIE